MKASAGGQGRYLRALNRAKVMEAAGISPGSPGYLWGSGFQSKGPKAHTGFEPVSGPSGIPEPLRRKLDELRGKNPRGARDGTG